MCRTKTQNDNYSPGGGEKKVKNKIFKIFVVWFQDYYHFLFFELLEYNIFPFCFKYLFTKSYFQDVSINRVF